MEVRHAAKWVAIIAAPLVRVQRDIRVSVILPTAVHHVANQPVLEGLADPLRLLHPLLRQHRRLHRAQAAGLSAATTVPVLEYVHLAIRILVLHTTAIRVVCPGKRRLRLLQAQAAGLSAAITVLKTVHARRTILRSEPRTIAVLAADRELAVCRRGR